MHRSDKDEGAYVTVLNGWYTHIISPLGRCVCGGLIGRCPGPGSGGVVGSAPYGMIGTISMVLALDNSYWAIYKMRLK
jgi:hypothetical protein